MYEFKAEQAMERMTAPAFDNGSTNRLVEIVQKSRSLAKEREDLEQRLLMNQAEITKTSGILQEMIHTMYQEDPVVKYLADAFIFVIGHNGIDPADRPSPF